MSVRTIWTNSHNSSGIQLLDLSEQDREQIRKWVALQTSRSENLKGWFLPKGAEAPPSQPSRHPELAELPLQPVEPTRKPEFAPMPLPIHGDFTYEPPPEPKRGFFSFRRGHKEPRVKSAIDSVASCPLDGTHAYGLFGARVVVPARSRGQIPAPIPASRQVEEAPSLDPSPPDAVPHKPAVPTPTEVPPEPRANAGPSDDTGSIPVALPPAAAKPVSPPSRCPSISNSRFPPLGKTRKHHQSPPSNLLFAKRRVPMPRVPLRFQPRQRQRTRPQHARHFRKRFLPRS